MKRLIAFILCILCITFLCACDNSDNTTATTATQATTSSTNDKDARYSGLPIVGTWSCSKVNEDCYFIFDANGDAFAKWGTTTVYGYFDYYEEDDIYDIDIPNFLYNEYKLSFDGADIRLQSEESSFTLKRATMPSITIKAPDNLVADEKLIGNWQSADTLECYEFKADNTVRIADLYNYTTVDCKYTCKDSKITFYYMSSATKDGNRVCEYSFSDTKLVIDGVSFENVTNT